MCGEESAGVQHCGAWGWRSRDSLVHLPGELCYVHSESVSFWFKSVQFHEGNDRPVVELLYCTFCLVLFGVNKDIFYIQKLNFSMCKLLRLDVCVCVRGSQIT